MAMNKAKSGGILAIISGLFGFVYTCFWLIVAYLRGVFSTEEPRYLPSELYIVVFAMVALYLIASSLAVFGGFFALRKQRWGLALAGSVCAIVMFSPCGIPALIFVIKAKSEFNAKLQTT